MFKPGSDPDAGDLFGGDPAKVSATRIERLFREHNEALLRFLRGRLSSEADAREAAQEAYVRLLQLDHPEQLSFLRAYLFKIAANVATDVVRRRISQRRAHAALPFDVADPPPQERALQARGEIRAVERALMELPPRCREAFVLSRREAWPTARIARHLGVSDRMVRLYLMRALEHIEAALDRRQEGERP